MVPRFTAVALVGLVALVGACDQPSPSAPVDALGSVKPPPDTDFDCLFTGNPSLSNSANSYFTTTADRKAASDLIAAMQAARDAENTELAREYGYELLSMVGSLSRGTTPVDREVGEVLTKQAFNCMYDTGGDDAASFEGWPDAAHYDFETALDAANGGAYFVRGDDEPSTAPAVGNLAALNNPPADPAGGNVSVLAPPLPAPEGQLPVNDTWSEVLGQQVLFFGNPVTDGYDWKVLPRDATFSPYARVALCQGVNGGDQEYDDADMVHQFGVGVLGFVDADGLCGTQPPFVALQGRGAFERLARLGRSLTALLTPEPLQASMAVALTRGGSASGAKGDEFTFENVPVVDLEVSVSGLGAKNTLKANTGRFSVTVVVTTPAPDEEPAGGIVVGLDVTNNNGTPTNIFQVVDPSHTGCGPNSPNEEPFVLPPLDTTLATIDVDGTTAVTKAEWTETLCVTNTGAITLNAFSYAAGNPSAGVGAASAGKKINVKP
jgi:hypothetical protein